MPSYAGRRSGGASRLRRFVALAIGIIAVVLGLSWLSARSLTSTATQGNAAGTTVRSQLGHRVERGDSTVPPTTQNIRRQIETDAPTDVVKELPDGGESRVVQDTEVRDRSGHELADAVAGHGDDDGGSNEDGDEQQAGVEEAEARGELQAVIDLQLADGDSSEEESGVPSPPSVGRQQRGDAEGNKDRQHAAEHGDPETEAPPPPPPTDAAKEAESSSQGIRSRAPVSAVVLGRLFVDPIPALRSVLAELTDGDELLLVWEGTIAASERGSVPTHADALYSALRSLSGPNPFPVDAMKNASVTAAIASEFAMHGKAASVEFRPIMLAPSKGALFPTWRAKVLEALKTAKHKAVFIVDATATLMAKRGRRHDSLHTALRSMTSSRQQHQALFASCAMVKPDAPTAPDTTAHQRQNHHHTHNHHSAAAVVDEQGTVPVLRSDTDKGRFVLDMRPVGHGWRVATLERADARERSCIAPSPMCFATQSTAAVVAALESDSTLVEREAMLDELSRVPVNDPKVRAGLGLTLMQELATFERIMTTIEVHEARSLSGRAQEIVIELGDTITRASRIIEAVSGRDTVDLDESDVQQAANRAHEFVAVHPAVAQRVIAAYDRFDTVLNYFSALTGGGSESKMLEQPASPAIEVLWRIAVSVAEGSQRRQGLAGSRACGPLNGVYATVRPSVALPGSLARVSTSFAEDHLGTLSRFAVTAFPLRSVTVTEAAAASSPSVEASWKKEAVLSRRTVLTRGRPATRHRTGDAQMSLHGVDDQCVGVANDSAVPGAVDAYRRLRLPSHQRHFCGLLHVYHHGGMYMDAGLQSTTGLAHWLDVKAPLVWFRTASAHSAGRHSAISTRFVAAHARHPCLRRALNRVVREALSQMYDPRVFAGSGLGEWLFDGVANVPSCVPHAQVALLDAATAIMSGHIGAVRSVEDEELRALATVRTSPLLRITFRPGDSKFSSSDEDAASDSFAEHEPLLRSVVIDDDDCDAFLGRVPHPVSRTNSASAVSPDGGQKRAVRFKALLEATKRLRHRHRAHVCGLAAVYHLGGMFMHEGAAWMEPAHVWVPRQAASFVADVTEAEARYWRLNTIRSATAHEGDAAASSSATDADDIASTWLFGAAPRDDDILQALQHLEAAAEAASTGDGSVQSFVSPRALAAAFAASHSVVWVQGAACVDVSGVHAGHCLGHGCTPTVVGDATPTSIDSAGTTSVADRIPTTLLLDDFEDEDSSPELVSRQQVWSREEPGFEARSISRDSCVLLLDNEFGKSKTVMDVNVGDRGRTPLTPLRELIASSPVKKLVAPLCSLVGAFVFGGVRVGSEAQWRRPVEQWLSLQGTTRGEADRLSVAQDAVLIVGGRPRACESHSSAVPAACRYIPAISYAASPRHPCLEAALATIAARVATIFHNCTSAAQLVDAPLEQLEGIADLAFTEAVESCRVGTVRELAPNTLAEFVERAAEGVAPSVALSSLRARQAWGQHLTVVIDGRARREPEQQLWNTWLQREPHLRHVRLTDTDCFTIINENRDTLFAHLAPVFKTLPEYVRLRLCRFVVTWEHGGVYADPTIGLEQPLEAWFPLIPAAEDNVSMAVAPEPPGGGHTKPENDERAHRPVFSLVFAARRHCPCLRQVLEYMDDVVPKIPFQHWTDSRSIPERVGPVAFGIGLRSGVAGAATGSAGLPQCASMPYLLTIDDIRRGTTTQEDATHWYHSRIEGLRHTLSTLDPATQPSSIFDARWLREEPSVSRRMMTSCHDVFEQYAEWAERLPSIRTALPRLPHDMRKLICGLLTVGRFGGYYIDEFVDWAQPLEQWIPKNASMVLVGAPEDRESRTDGGDQANRSSTHQPSEAFATFFFAAQHNHPCIFRALDTIEYRVNRSLGLEVNTSSSSKHMSMGKWLRLRRANRTTAFDSWLAGPRALQDAIQACNAVDVVIPYEKAATEFMRYRPPVTLATGASAPPVSSSPGEEAAASGALLIPPLIHVIWKSTTIDGIAGFHDSRWRANEPLFARRVVTDDECAKLAHEDFPHLGAIWDTIPLNVMRADACRLLAVYRYGGLYMDLDVVWARPLVTWYNRSKEIVIASENEWHFCNWIFGARPRHPCVARVLNLMSSRLQPQRLAQIREVKYDFVHFVTGPRVFTDGMHGCAQPSLDGLDVTNRLVSHRFASTEWAKLSPAERGGITSWREERDKLWNKEKPKSETDRTVPPV